jgi:hypothetical protein
MGGSGFPGLSASLDQLCPAHVVDRSAATPLREDEMVSVQRAGRFQSFSALHLFSTLLKSGSIK